MTVYSLVILPIGAEFLVLPVCHVGERATPAGVFSAAIHPMFHRANASTFEVPRFRWLEGVWPLRRLRSSYLTANLSLTLHYFFHFFIFFYRVCYIMNLLLNLILCLIESILYVVTSIITYEARWTVEPLDRFPFLDAFVLWPVCADILTLLSQLMHSVSSVTVLCHAL